MKYLNLLTITFVSFLSTSSLVASSNSSITDIESDFTLIDAPTKISGYSLGDISTHLELLGEGYRINDEKEEALSRLKEKGFDISHPSDKEPKLVSLKQGDDVYLLYLGAQQEDLNSCYKFFGTFLPYANGRVHRGFANRFHDAWDDIYIDISKYALSIGKKITDLNYKISGHSMGGALAVLAALRLNVVSFNSKVTDHIQVITFGSPRVFDFDTAKQYEQLLGHSTLRVVHEGEGMVPSFPCSSNGSMHVGVLFETPKPGVSEITLKSLQHTYPAYRDSLSKSTSDTLNKALDLVQSYDYFGSAWSGLKNILGTPRSYLYDYFSDTLIEHIDQEKIEEVKEIEKIEEL